MMTSRQLKLLQKNAVRERQVIEELNAVVRDIERCEKSIIDLHRELAEVNSQYPNPRTTREDVAYLSGLLECAKKKLVWEKHISSLQKRTPSILQEMAELLNNPELPPPESSRAEMLQTLQKVQAAMERLGAANAQ